MNVAALNLLAGWLGMLGGVLSGAAIGLFFHREEWMGGYSSFRRRMTRLGHISFFGLGFLNMAFAFTAGSVAVPQPYLSAASLGFLIGAASMPVCCFLTAWRRPFRHLFPIPVGALLLGVAILLTGWVST